MNNARWLSAYLYDVMGQVTQINLPNGQVQVLEYNSSGQLTQYTDEAGRTTQYQYDGLSQVRRRIDPMGQTLNYLYDKERNLVALQNEKGEVHRLKYDKNERLIAETGFDGRQQHYQYNPSGHLIAQIDGSLAETIANDAEQAQAPVKPEFQAADDALLTQFQRNPLGLLIAKITADGEQTSFDYTPSGQVTGAENSQSKIIFAYDSTGNQIEETQIVGENKYSLIHEFDALGNRIKSTLPTGQAVTYEYNHQQLFTQVAIDGEIISQLQRDALGREIGRQQGSLKARYHYDPMGRLTRHQVTHQKTKQTIVQRGYGYDHAGNLATIDDLTKGNTHYQYDALNRLTKVKSFISEQFDFDPAGNLLAQQNSQEIEQAIAQANTAQAQNKTPQVTGNRLAFQGDKKFTYDRRGNLIKELRGKGGQLQTEFSYNASNQLIKVTKKQAGKEEEYSYQYDALGRRINKTTPEQSIHFVWNNDVLLSESTTDKETKQTIDEKIYLYEPDSFKPLAIIQDKQIYHYHLDHLGTPQELTAHNGELAWSVHYKAYGNVVKKVVESIENNLRFQGQYYDVETGLHYNRHRYYDPTTARFISLDPIGLLGGNNNYQYAPNPVSWIDPLGLVCEERYARYKLEREKGLSASDAAKLSKSKPDYYVKSNGDVYPSAYYRYANSKYSSIEDVKTGMLPKKRGGTYVSFDKIDDSIVASDKLQIPYRPDYRVSGNTLDVIDDIEIPKGNWGQSEKLEPITSDFKKFGPGKATQAVIKGEVPVNPESLEKLL
ncbi:RHS repeat-associated core domain-containing protein [sulfur-oxidizing endosymbiont of Gigantopelta aegis]|uniref:RHS repeat-associated core domain-containing protein n=1 Tax=sulfur-oxidizing endosymbiont of Gigantopelta aegis TaxID=2794934 RepID=UPI0018DDF25F|nr:RHS repeat-associated core domain-containing protein [sulfur-oxidizing endosymbiont of Gigantopelta aegis]